MEFTGSYRIAAPRDLVWAGLNDPEILRQAIPGCEALTKQSDTAYTATVATKLGPMRVKFTGKVTLSDLDPPNGYRIAGEGQGGIAGFAKGAARVTLTPDGDGTDLSYAAEATVGGKMAQLGARLIDASARKLADEFFASFSALVAGDAGNEEAAVPPREDAPEGAPTEGEPPAKASAQDLAAPARPGVPTALWVTGLIAVIVAILALFLG